MAAVVEIDEINGTAPGTTTHAITHGHYGSVDAVHLDEVANPLAASTNSFEKWQRLHLTDLGGSAAVKTLRYWSDTARPSGSTFQFNGHVTQGTYDTSKKTTYETPGTGTTKTPNSVPTSAPGSANIGIGGSLTGSLTSAGSTDFVVSQIRVTTATQSADPQIHWDYDEVA